MAFTVMQGKISKGNSTGTGWLTLPSHLRGTVSPSKWYDLILSSSSLDYLLLTRKLTKYKNIEGFYIPKALCSTHNLIGQVVSVSLRPTSYFVSRISKDKRIRFPNSVVEEFSIQNNDLFEIEIKTRDTFVREIVLVTTIDNSNRVNCASEFYFIVRMQDIPTSIEAKIKVLRKIQRVFPKGKKVTEDEFFLPDLFPDAVIAKYDSTSIIIFHGNHVPIICPIKIHLPDLIHYFKCYYTDRVLVESGWIITASTPEQADYYIEIHNKLILNAKLDFELIYVKKSGDEHEDEFLTCELYSYWKINAKISLSKDKIHILSSSSSQKREWNEYGSLRIRENRFLILELYLRLLKVIKAQNNSNFLQN